MNTLPHPCPRCSHPAQPAYNGQLYLRGWLCSNQRCRHWEAAIGRERKFRKEPG
ncbi:hypothetical protein [Microbulbifer sp. JSM ZJ756]|uniref:hypothetical protein n=1 Tax=Microbulbifer sp. JSM ZJ756 TaxID=3376191 RepID=UPI0037B1473F